VGRSNYGLSGGDDEAQQGPVLADCPCGEVAAWYRVDGNANAPEQDGGRAQRAVSDITSDGLPSSLCGECFQDAVPESERGRWRRIEVPEAQQERRWANQVRLSRGWEDNQDSGDW
jgi:hypothetical protein